MLKIRHIVLFLSISLLIACDNSLSSEENFLIGTWVDNGYNNDVRVLKISKEFSDDLGGYRFNPDHTLIDRKNVGWCGTPPVSYGNYDGVWEITAENELEIISEYWGGIDTLHYEIVKISQSELHLKYIY